MLAFTFLLVQLRVSVRDRARLAVPVGDPWDGRSLEWGLPAPPPEWNFPALPRVEGRDAFATLKMTGEDLGPPDDGYEDIRMPKNAVLGPVIGALGTGLAFALTWYLWWLALPLAALVPVVLIAQGFRRDTEKVIPAHEVRETWRAFRALAARTPRVSRRAEYTRDNRGHAIPMPQEAAE